MARRGPDAIDKALADLDEAIRIDPRYADAYAGRGGLRIKNKEHEKALADCNEAIRLDPGTPWPTPIVAGRG